MYDIKCLSKILQPKQMINRDVKLGCKHSFSSAIILYRHINFTYPKAYRYKIIYKFENLRLQKFIFFLLRKNENINTISLQMVTLFSLREFMPYHF